MLEPIYSRLPSWNNVTENLSACSTVLQDKIYEVLRYLFEAPVGYFVKISVFRQEVLRDRFSQYITLPFVQAVENVWRCARGAPRGPAFDPARAQRSVDFLREFAEVTDLQTPDGRTIQWALYRPEKFQEWIDANGGIRRGDRIVPRTPADWPRVKRLNEFKWFTEDGQSIVVPAPVGGAGDKCILRCIGYGRQMSADKAFIGVHLAAGFNYAVFQWNSGNGSSLSKYANDAEGCYQAVLREGFPPSKITIMASCRGTFTAVQLKASHHAEGVNAVLIQPPPSLRATIANQAFPANWIGLLGLGAIERDGEHCDSIRRLQSLPHSGGRLCVIVSEGDRTIPADTAEQFARVAGPAGPSFTIRESLVEGGADPHLTEPLHNPETFRRYTEFVAGREP